VHPVLGPALQDFHDRLVWSKDEPELGAEGIELFRLNHAFFHAGYPIISMPPPRVAAGIIWNQTMRFLDPQYRAAMRGASLGPDVEPVLMARTIHGSKTLLTNRIRVQRQIIGAFRSAEWGCGPGHIRFDEFTLEAEKAVIRAAERFNPDLSSFPTYIHHRLRGL